MVSGNDMEVGIHGYGGESGRVWDSSLAVETIDDLERSVFGGSLSTGLPEHVLPVSTHPDGGGIVQDWRCVSRRL